MIKSKSITKVFFLGALTLIAFSSCRKNRTCVCTDAQGLTDTYPILLSKKKDAKVICDSYEYSSYSCELE